MLVFALLAWHAFYEDLPSIEYLSPNLRIPMGMMTTLHAIPGWDWIYTTGWVLVALKWATVAGCVVACAGWWHLWSVALATVLSLIYGGILREYSHLFYTMLLPLQLAFILSVAPTGKSVKIGEVVHLFWRNPSWYWQVVLTLIAMTYFISGLGKLLDGGLMWWSGENIRHLVLFSNYSGREFDLGLKEFFYAVPAFVYAGLGLFTLAVELLFPLVLFQRHARIILPLCAVAMHLGIWVVQGILFLDLIALQVLFLLPSAPLLALQKKQLAGVGVVAALPLLLCLLHIESYPLSAWRLFAEDRAGKPVKVWSSFAETPTQSKAKFMPDDIIGALDDCRYRDYYMRGRFAVETMLKDVLEQRSTWKQVWVEEWEMDASGPRPKWSRLGEVRVVSPERH